MKIFKDRKSAGKLLAKRLKDTKADLVIGIPRGGVVVAVEIAKELKLPMDILVTRKIGAPTQPELALGAVDPDGEVAWEKELINDLRLKINDLGNEVKEQWKEVKRREDVYRSTRTHTRSLLAKLDGRTVILVDDGAATGATVLAAVRYLKRHGAKTVVGLPVASKDALWKISKEVDKIIVLDTPENFHSVGQFFKDFPQISDEEVLKLLT